MQNFRSFVLYYLTAIKNTYIRQTVSLVIIQQPSVATNRYCNEQILQRTNTTTNGYQAIWYRSWCVNLTYPPTPSIIGCYENHGLNTLYLTYVTVKGQRKSPSTATLL